MTAPLPSRSEFQKRFLEAVPAVSDLVDEEGKLTSQGRKVALIGSLSISSAAVGWALARVGCGLFGALLIPTALVLWPVAVKTLAQQNAKKANHASRGFWPSLPHPVTPESPEVN